MKVMPANYQAMKAKYMITLRRRGLLLSRMASLFIIFFMLFSVISPFITAPAAKADDGAVWDAINTIYYNPSQEESNNTFLYTAAQELKTYLQQMSGRAWTVVTNTPPVPPAIYLAVDATMLAAHGDEAFRLVVDSNGVTITGKTAIACLWGAYYLLDEKLGVRWFFKSPAWTVMPDSLIDLGTTDTIVEPDFFWRQLVGFSSVGQTDSINWIMHNRELGAKSYADSQGYDALMDLAVGWGSMTTQQKTDYYNAHPTYFYPTGGYVYNWNLNLATPAVTAMAVAYAESVFASLYGNGPVLHYGSVAISPRDNGAFNPPYASTDIQDITDLVFGGVNAVAAGINVDYPDKYILVFNYLSYSGIPSFALEPNLLVPVTSDYNNSNLTNYERVEGLLAKGVKVGWYDFVCHSDGPRMNYDVINILKWLGNNDVKWYAGETIDCWGGRSGLTYYIMSKLFWDCNLNVDDILADFYTKAFGPAAAVMQKYYEVRDTDSISLAQSFNYLNQAETLAAGNSAVLTRIRQLEYYNRYVWKYNNIGITHLTLSDLESFYTFICKIRDTYMTNYSGVDPAGDEANLKAELIRRGLTSGQVTALQDFTPPTAGETATWLSEAMSAFSSYLTLPGYTNIKAIDLETLSNTMTQNVNPLYGGSRDILVYSSGNENVTIRAKTNTQFSIGWYNPNGIMTSYWTQTQACDWTNHSFPAVEAGYYLLHVNRGTPLPSVGTYIDVQNRPASIVADYRVGLYRLEKDTDYTQHDAPWFSGTNSQYFYVPAGTSNFTFGTNNAFPDEPTLITGSLIDPNNVNHNFNFPTSDGEITITTPVAGLWKLTFTSSGSNYFWFKGIPPFVWHDPKYLLVQATGSPAPGQPAGNADINGDGMVNILDIIGIAQHWGETGVNDWIREDVNNDGTIDILDITIVGQNWTG